MIFIIGTLTKIFQFCLRLILFGISGIAVSYTASYTTLALMLCVHLLFYKYPRYISFNTPEILKYLLIFIIFILVV